MGFWDEMNQDGGFYGTCLGGARGEGGRSKGSHWWCGGANVLALLRGVMVCCCFLLLWVLEDRSNRFRPVLEESEARGLRLRLLALKTKIAW